MIRKADLGGTPLMVLCALILGLSTACAPQYPYCEVDQQCQVVAPYLHCVQGQCAHCRDNSQCNRGTQCQAGTCVVVSGWCESSASCPDGQLCDANRCRPCEVDRECGSSNRCEVGRCLSGPRECLENQDCRETGQVCEMGRCR